MLILWLQIDTRNVFDLLVPVSVKHFHDIYKSTTQRKNVIQYKAQVIFAENVDRYFDNMFVVFVGSSVIEIGI